MKTIFLAIAYQCTVLHAYQPWGGWNGVIEPTPDWDDSNVPDETSWNEPTSGWDVPPSWNEPTNWSFPTWNWTSPTWNWTSPTWNWTSPTWNQSSWNISSFNDTPTIKKYGNITNEKGNTMYVKGKPGVETDIDGLVNKGTMVFDLQTKQTIKNNLRGGHFNDRYRK
eukprot:CAMPEP_0203747844 /NCGR_PEP_ID=MMETSP0098-20131031/2885_1 /ASSEMBLY_ACC=CAM_ASM_000208 /TAXON_ID=96639 /ORGANISM=" , Strain NY0313808BC1" /LENGTH=166 /DNA_ID=CAMNT_0050636409 /DNA_START=54 /DNA_END=551 /DNA_ORIENTATION=+